MPVTHGVAGSSPVRTARKASKIFGAFLCIYLKCLALRDLRPGDIRVAVACAGIASSCPSASFEICWKVPGHWSRNFFMPEF